MTGSLPYIGRLSKENSKKYILLAKHTAKGANIKRIVEPFACFAYYSSACVLHGFKGETVLNFSDPVYACLFNFIIDTPDYISEGYADLWPKQFGDENLYDSLLKEFEGEKDMTKKAVMLIYLLEKGKRNKTEHKGTYGRVPDEMKLALKNISFMFKGRTEITLNDNNIFPKAKQGDMYFADRYDAGLNTVSENGAEFIVVPVKKTENMRGLKKIEINNMTYFKENNDESAPKRTGNKTIKSI